MRGWQTVQQRSCAEVTWALGFFLGSIGVRWVLARQANVSYHNKETTSFTIDPYYDSLNLNP